MDASGDGKASPYNSVDAIFSTARYLRASGAPGSYRRAIYAYNHAGWYVNLILRTSRQYRTMADVGSVAAPPVPLSALNRARAQTVNADLGLGFKAPDPVRAARLRPPVVLPPEQDETLYER